MRNLKELMKDDSGIGILSNCVCDSALLCCHGLNCIGSFEQSAFIAVAALINYAWTFLQASGVKMSMIHIDAISNVCGK